ncbi:sigma-70 family RNA polymerase sigma factor [Aquimarina sp. AD10]|uniref:RNA polymerase subunit sigma-70 n=1 Tax=Aquimarina aggregata TaxID=1642818 RepID=A0A162CV46_9FLAO|nr:MULTISPECIES: sigma-70 family RNA polymerase sigma factor [Aquimarina]AXT59370.1 sigma-70 family RNA polymerase sigma factor [Aquimarina sp. AD10]KZS42634.1 RNA polymerase subunit sigma-70 [Aquimarina aggregata]RKM94185.1 sigma-70 family RNA polymerase sigma factor [Aquimarina sp. AD10]
MPEKEISVCEEKVYEQLYREHAEKICYYLYYKYGDMEKAQDIVQDSFAKLWVNCSNIIFGAAKSFLYKIAKNASINAVLHQKTVLKYQSIEQKTYTNESPEFQMEENEFMEKLNNAISELREGQREVFLLNRIEKKTYREIAEMLDISVKAVEKRMHLALVSLRTKLKTSNL